MKRSVTTGALLAILAAVVAIFTPAAGAARTACPSSVTPAPGSTVQGGLEVDGPCILDDVAVVGSVVVDPSGGLQLSDNSSVLAGIVVNGGELDIDHNLGSSGLIPGTSRVYGGITMRSPSDYDIETATILGGIRESGDVPAAPTICGNTISGGIQISDSASDGVFIGDPTDTPVFSGFLCAGNTIGGGVALINASTFYGLNNAIEGNTIRWAVTLDDSVSEVNGNSITGGVNCLDGGYVVPGEAPDPASNPCNQFG